MSIPINTTTIAVERAPDRSNIDPDEYDSTDFATVASGIRAVIDVKTGSSGGPGDRQTVIATLICDPTDLRYLDRVRDERTGDRYAVEWSFNSPGIAGYLALTKAGLSFQN